jgi:hypothetical protein
MRFEVIKKMWDAIARSRVLVFVVVVGWRQEAMSDDDKMKGEGRETTIQ